MKNRQVVVWAACFMQHPMMVFRSYEKAEARAFVVAKKRKKDGAAKFWHLVRCVGELPKKRGT